MFCKAAHIIPQGWLRKPVIECKSARPPRVPVLNLALELDSNLSMRQVGDWHSMPPASCFTATTGPKSRPCSCPNTLNMAQKLAEANHFFFPFSHEQCYVEGGLSNSH